jgi:hypothetical protein
MVAGGLPTMKLCRTCGRTLPLSEFHKNSRSPDGLNWKCRGCAREEAQRYIHSEKGIANRKAYREAHRVEHREYKKKKRAEYAIANPQEFRARWLVGNAVRHGFIPRPEADRNWHNRWQFHHPDYKRPYYGVWVTIPDHALIHRGKKECPPCKDWVSEVRNGVMREWDLF